MSGETEKEESGWTVDTVKYYVDERFDSLYQAINNLRTLLDERYQTQTKATDAAFAAQQTAMQTAFTAADKAVDKALESQSKAVDTARVTDQEAVDKALTAAEKAVDRRQDTADKEFHEHLEQVRHENRLALDNQRNNIQAAFVASDRAISKAETATEKRFESVNEFRAQLNDQARTLLPRNEYDAAHGTLVDQVNELKDRMNRAEGNGLGKNQLWGYMIAAIAALGTIVIVTNVLIGR